MEKAEALRAAEASGTLADSMTVRLALMARVRAGEISLADAQAELRRIKRAAKQIGLPTRSSTWRAA